VQPSAYSSNSQYPLKNKLIATEEQGKFGITQFLGFAHPIVLQKNTKFWVLELYPFSNKEGCVGTYLGGPDRRSYR
jgi:hypothetical protein